jgi:hypothetical protein
MAKACSTGGASLAGWQLPTTRSKWRSLFAGWFAQSMRSGRYCPQALGGAAVQAREIGLGIEAVQLAVVSLAIPPLLRFASGRIVRTCLQPAEWPKTGLEATS